MKKTFVLVFALAALVIAASAQGGTFKASFPLFTTSAGQSNDVNTVNIVLEEAEIKYDYCDVPTVELLQAGVGLAGK
ncbi:MAG: DUF6305 family protein, partial [Candidatus Aminicenantales bacterium]